MEDPNGLVVSDLEVPYKVKFYLFDLLNHPLMRARWTGPWSSSLCPKIETR